jgi:hypothetical protein
MSVIEDWYRIIVEKIQSYGWLLLFGAIAFFYVRPYLMSAWAYVKHRVGNEDRRNAILDKHRKSAWSKK